MKIGQKVVVDTKTKNLYMSDYIKVDILDKTAAFLEQGVNRKFYRGKTIDYKKSFYNNINATIKFRRVLNG